jgi:hypothetical protein
VKTRRRFTLEIRDAAGPGDADVWVRLRAVLKRLLKGYGFRCTSIREAEGTGEAAEGKNCRGRPTGDDG